MEKESKIEKPEIKEGETKEKKEISVTNSRKEALTALTEFKTMAEQGRVATEFEKWIHSKEAKRLTYVPCPSDTKLWIRAWFEETRKLIPSFPIITTDRILEILEKIRPHLEEEEK